MPQLKDALLEAKERLEEFGNASFQNADDALRRFYYTLRPESDLGKAIREALPQVDFDSWLENVSSTKGGMVGSGRLSWPPENDKRVALQLELVRRLSDDVEEIDLLDFTHDFTYVGNKFNLNLGAFFDRVLVPFYNDILRLLKPVLEPAGGEQTPLSEKTESRPLHFIDQTRLEELRGIDHEAYDLKKLIQLCVEIDFCYRNDCFLAVAALTRALLDHVPPIFGCASFAEVSNNYKGARSFRESMLHLENSARKIGDAHLHTQIRKSESLPVPTQVNFANDLDVLLAEVVRVLSE